MADEKRLIDANTIPWEEHYVPDGNTQWGYKKELCVLKPVIDAMPTVDAVEVPDKKLLKAIKLLIKQYEHSKNSEYVHNPVAHALFHTWKQVDKELKTDK